MLKYLDEPFEGVVYPVDCAVLIIDEMHEHVDGKFNHPFHVEFVQVFVVALLQCIDTELKDQLALRG